MSSSDHGNQQNQKVGSNSGQAGQAGHNLTQIQNKIYIGSSFFKDNLEEVDFWNRPCHFISVILFLLQIMLVWIVMGFRTEYKFPFKTLRSLIFATINGELVEYVSENQVKNNEKIARIVDGIDREYISIDKSITLELETEIAIKIIGFLSSNDLDKKEDLAEFLGDLKSYYDSFTTQIENQKREKYRELYEWRKDQNKTTSNTKTLKFINQLIALSSSKSPSDTLIYDLIETTENYISQEKRGLSIQELSDLKQLKRFLILISEKFVTDNSKPSSNFQFRYNSLAKDLDDITKKNKELKRHSNALEKEIEKASKELNTAKYVNAQLKDESIRLKDESLRLKQKERNLEESMHEWTTYSEQLKQSNERINQELVYLKAELNNKNQIINRLNDPVFYLREYSKINCISKTSSSKYHDNPKCRDWRGFVLDYIIKKNKGDSIEEFIVSEEYEHRKFMGKEKCINCQ